MIHHEHRYDSFYRLKVPPLLWLVLGYGLRHVVSLLPAVRTAGGEWVALLGDWRLVAADALVLVVLIASGYRVPDTGRIMREVWHHGRELLLISYGLSMVMLVVIHWGILSRISDYQFPSLVGALIVDSVIIAYLVRSRLLRDVFADFPEATDRVISKVPPKSGNSARDLAEELLHAEIVSGSSGIDMPTLETQNPAQMMAQAARCLSANHSGEAERIYRRLLESLPDFAPAWHELGLLAVSLGRMEQAAQLIRQAAMLDSSNALYRRNLGEIYRRLGRLAEAIHALHEAIHLAPDDPDAHYNLALALADARRQKEAIASYRQAINLNPAHGQAWNNLGVLLRQQGNELAARQAFEKALAIQPGHAEANTNLHAMKPAHKTFMVG